MSCAREGYGSHRVGNPQCQLESGSPLLAADHDVALAPNRVHEALELEG